MNLFCFFCIADGTKTLAFTAWNGTPCCAEHAKLQMETQRDWQLRQAAAQEVSEEVRQRMANAIEEVKDKI